MAYAPGGSTGYDTTPPVSAVHHSSYGSNVVGVKRMGQSDGESQCQKCRCAGYAHHAGRRRGRWQRTCQKTDVG